MTAQSSREKKKKKQNKTPKKGVCNKQCLLLAIIIPRPTLVGHEVLFKGVQMPLFLLSITPTSKLSKKQNFLFI